jgi:hypothetical protein
MEKEMVTRIIRITPAVATSLLASQENNRALSPCRVERYANDMKNGNWRKTHEGIAFDSNDRLMDGQHRLHAIIKSGVTIDMMATYGIDETSFDVINTGGNRSGKDVLSISGLAPRISRIMASAIPYCYAYERGFSPGTKINGTRHGNPNVIILNYYANNAKIADSATFITKMPRRDALLPESISCFAHYQISKLHDDADDFITQVLTGAGVDSGSIVFELRRVLIASRIGNHRLVESAVVNKVIGAYNHFHSNKSFKDPQQVLSRFKADSQIRFI